MAWSAGASRGVAEQGDEDPLDDEFAGGNQVGILGVGGAEERMSFFDQIAFEGGFAIDQRGHDVPFAGFPEFENHGIAMADMGIDHRVAAHFEGECPGVAGNPQ